MPPKLRWIEPRPVSVPESFREAIGGHPLVAETLYRRGLRSLPEARAFMNPDVYTPTSPDELPDAPLAYELLSQAIQAQSRILIWGDFDVDGQTATTVLVEGLRGLHANVRYHIPVRAKESHGITAGVLSQYLAKGFDLLLTCDTGISEHANLQTVREAGIPIIVTDHHTLSATLPPANAIVNPQRLPESHPLRSLPGVGVAYMLMEGLYQFLSMPFNPGPLQELAALGIVADVATLEGDTRYLLQKGLQHLQHTERVGLQTLFANTELNPQFLTEDHIGFQIAPRLNAVGRLGDANPMVEFLTTTDTGRARVIGSQIEAMNAKRRFTTSQVVQAAEKMLQDSPDDRHAAAIVLHHPDWPGGVVGIVASRLVEQYQKPALLLTGSDPIHGSARSVEGINITEAIGTQASLLTGFGGHPMAAGLAFPAADYLAFKRGFQSAVEARAETIKRTPEIEIHQSLPLEEISLELIAEVQRLAPFGPGNPALNFMVRDLNLVSVHEIGQTGEHRQVIAADESGAQHRFIWWNGADEPLPEAQFDLICRFSRSDYKGAPQVSAEWIAWRLSERGRETVSQRHFEIIDQRLHPAPQQWLHRIRETEPDLQVWGEGPLPKDLPALGRDDLQIGAPLMVWTAPPSQSILNTVIRTLTPEKVYLLGLDPGLDDDKLVKARVAGLAKYAITHKHGQFSLNELATACAATPETVRVTLQLWEALGKLEITFMGDQVNVVLSDMPPNPESIKILSELLQQLLAEAGAYRRYFTHADLMTILEAKEE